MRGCCTLGDLDGMPMFTITSLQRLEPRAPSVAYLRTMFDGLGEALGWNPDERVRYLMGARGVTPAWTTARIIERCGTG